MIKDKEIKGAIGRAIDILRAECDRIEHIIQLLEGTATIREINNGESNDAKTAGKNKKPTKPGTKPKQTYIVRQKHIAIILEGTDEPMSVYSIAGLLLKTFNVSATDGAIKKVLKVDAGRTFRESEDGLWTLVE